MFKDNFTTWIKGMTFLPSWEGDKKAGVEALGFVKCSIFDKYSKTPERRGQSLSHGCNQERSKRLYRIAGIRKIYSSETTQAR